MDYFRLGLITLASALAVTGVSQANDTNINQSASRTSVNTIDAVAAIRAAMGAREQAIVDVSAEDVREVSQNALNTVVAQGIRALSRNGDGALANRYEREWNHSYSNFLLSFGSKDLGDHSPLSKWLADFYDKLEDRLGTSMIHTGVLGDVYLLNFALPVVFAPKGSWRSTSPENRDWVEYRKHLIPFANVVTYWGSLFACNKVMAQQMAGKQGKDLCKKVATKLRFVMGRYIAPKISDFVFNRVNGLPGRLEITAQDRVYVTAEELARAIELEGAL